MLLRLQSDFLDYYDHWFDREGENFKRLSHSGMTRRDMLSYLNQVGEKTPIHGVVHELVQMGISKLVVYTDETAHRAEGKLLLSASDALKRYPYHWCSEFIEDGISANSIRRLQIGDYCFWLSYQSNDEWRSNYGDVQINIENQENRCHPFIDLPLFAIDYVGIRRYAVDFNIAPQINGTGIEELLTAKDLVATLKNSIKSSKLKEKGVRE